MIQGCFFKIVYSAGKCMVSDPLFRLHPFHLGPDGYDFHCHAFILFIDSSILSKILKKDCFGMSSEIEKIRRNFLRIFDKIEYLTNQVLVLILLQASRQFFQGLP